MGNEDTYDYIVRLEFVRLTLEALYNIPTKN
jgi:hypothetical protein